MTMAFVVLKNKLVSVNNERHALEVCLQSCLLLPGHLYQMWLQDFYYCHL